MDLTYVSIVVLSSLIFVVSGIIGYLYWQQTRLLQQLQTLALVVATKLSEQQQVEELEPESEEEDDDRVEVVEGPTESVPPVQEPSVSPTPTATSASEDDVDDIQHKTVKELHELLTKKGIPYGKRDAKTVLLQLLRATA